MTAEPQPLDRLASAADLILRVLAWATQAAAATIYVIIGSNTAAWRPVFDKDPVGTLCTGTFAIGMLAFWALSLWEEQQRFYDRTIQRSRRRLGLISHLSVLLIAAAAASASHDRLGLWIGLGIICFSALATWTAWMQTRLLPDEDQAVIDTIIAREVAQRAAQHDATERERRRIRLANLVETLGYTLNDTQAAATQTTDRLAIRWTIPAGKHTPLVYFIRNGNRMKIGTTTELKRRIRTLALRPENVALLVAGDHRREREYHQQFAEHRIGKTEWFAYEGTLAAYVHDQADRITKGQQP